MIEELTKRVTKGFNTNNDDESHDDPLADFLPYVGLDDLTEAKAADEHDGGDGDCRPNHETFAKSFDVHVLLF